MGSNFNGIGRAVAEIWVFEGATWVEVDLWQLKSEVPLIWNIYGYFQEFSLGPTDLFKKNPENSYKNSILRDF